MKLGDFVSGCLQQHYNAMARSVDGLTEVEMAWMPTPECSSIGFLVWHYGRTMDRWVHSRLRNIPQLWDQGWAERLGQQDIDPNDTGYGYGPEQLAAFQVPESAALLEYGEATLEAALSYLQERNDTDPGETEVTNPRGGTMSLANYVPSSCSGNSTSTAAKLPTCVACSAASRIHATAAVCWKAWLPSLQGGWQWMTASFC